MSLDRLDDDLAPAPPTAVEGQVERDVLAIAELGPRIVPAQSLQAEIDPGDRRHRIPYWEMAPPVGAGSFLPKAPEIKLRHHFVALPGSGFHLGVPYFFRRELTSAPAHRQECV